MKKIYKILFWQSWENNKFQPFYFVDVNGKNEFTKQEAETNIEKYKDDEKFKNCILEIKEFYRQ